MFTNIKEALYYIENRRVKRSFDDFKMILDKEQIDYSLPCIHVTGTNGKGGTINFIAHILREAGYKVGTFTSPYIVKHQDRFMVNGKMMSDEELLDYINRNVAIIEKYNLAMFEIDFIIMLEYFKKEQVDIALIEVGIGARNDKTNMVLPKASIITNVGHDHLAQIGPTLKDVAYEKAGIIKEGVPVFTMVKDPELLDIIQKEAIEKNALLYAVEGKVDDLKMHLQGKFHRQNAFLARKVVETIFPEISRECIDKGLCKAVWPGRFECFKIGESLVYLDGAHNLHAMKMLIETVKDIEKPTFIYAALQDKDYMEMAQMIKEASYDLEVCVFDDGRALDLKRIQDLPASKVYDSIENCISTISQTNKNYIVCGSLHFISQFRDKVLQM